MNTPYLRDFQDRVRLNSGIIKRSILEHGLTLVENGEEFQSYPEGLQNAELDE
jgi:hypothetical protein